MNTMANKTALVTPSEIVLYKSPTGNIKMSVLFRDKNVWLTQAQISSLFERDQSVISRHVKNIYSDEELTQKSTMQILHNANSDKPVIYYSLPTVIAIGYRIKSGRGTQFRIWATKTLEKFITKGFVLDVERLKTGSNFGEDYFNELLENIREIRASERRFYQKITDIYATAVDYDKDASITRDFFATVQNILHWAISGQTAAEIIYTQVNFKKNHLGLSTWKYAPKGKINKSDVVIAKNYLNLAQIKELEQVVSAYLDLAENRAKRHIITRMVEWTKFLKQILIVANYPILNHKGRVSNIEAELKAVEEYNKFRIIQDRNYQSDFDKAVELITQKNTHES